MKDFVLQILTFYKEKMRSPKLDELTLVPEEYKNTQWCVCITLYVDGEVRGSAGNIKEIHGCIAEEIIASTIEALTNDSRFGPLKREEFDRIEFRGDIIKEREMVHIKDLEAIDPVKLGAITIARNYESLAFILPNISPKLLTGADSISALSQKLWWAKLDDKKYIFYTISTKSETSF